MYVKKKLKRMKTKQQCRHESTKKCNSGKKRSVQKMEMGTWIGVVSLHNYEQTNPHTHTHNHMSLHTMMFVFVSTTKPNAFVKRKIGRCVRWMDCSWLCYVSLTLFSLAKCMVIVSENVLCSAMILSPRFQSIQFYWKMGIDIYTMGNVNLRECV